MMIRWSVPVEAGNKALADGTLMTTVGELMDHLKPEAAYFWPENGTRSGMAVFDMADPSEIPQITEGLFTKLNAAVSFDPVMNPEDLKKGLSG
jgi:hypothetical protein